MCAIRLKVALYAKGLNCEPHHMQMNYAAGVTLLGLSEQCVQESSPLSEKQVLNEMRISGVQKPT
ncbi:hypothetical protein RHIZ404_230452 [Rhizobium sp. EC-SD404]|nr:hypothetical protein RHIZ404_230452 [Rhizobium sp. EC-SD404]